MGRCTFSQFTHYRYDSYHIEGKYQNKSEQINSGNIVSDYCRMDYDSEHLFGSVLVTSGCRAADGDDQENGILLNYVFFIILLHHKFSFFFQSSLSCTSN